MLRRDFYEVGIDLLSGGDLMSIQSAGSWYEQPFLTKT